MAFGQVRVKYEIDCDSVFQDSEGIHRPTKNSWFMAATDIKNPSNWKNEDTINLSTFTIDNLKDNMPIIILSPSTMENKNTGEITFSSLIYFDHGEYGENWDSSYCAKVKIKNNILIFKEKYWWSKGKGKKYKFQIVWKGENCCQWIRVNSTKRRLYPKPYKK